jgi:hypothetical protein
MRDITARGSLVMFSPLPESRVSAIPALPEIFRRPSLMAEDKIRAVLRDLLEAANRSIVSTEQMRYDVFLADLKIQDAVVRTLEILGEATQPIPDEFRQQAPHLPLEEYCRDEGQTHSRDGASRTILQISPEPFCLYQYNIQQVMSKNALC